MSQPRPLFWLRAGQTVRSEKKKCLNKTYSYTINAKKVVVNPKDLLGDMAPWIDNSEISWIAELHYNFSLNSRNYNETFHSARCTQSTEGEQCSESAKLPQLPFFKKSCPLRIERIELCEARSECVLNEYLSRDEMLGKVNKKNEDIAKKHSQLFIIASKNLNLRLRVRNTKEKI